MSKVHIVNRSLVHTLVAGLAAATGCTMGDDSPSVAAGRVTVIENVHVLPMDGQQVLRDQTVIVRDSLITEVVPSATAQPPRGSRRIDGEGRYLMPGVADMHIHLRSERELLSYAAHGVTTVFNLGGAYPEAPDLLRYRRELSTGERVGPTLYTSGPLLDGDPPIFANVSEPVGSPDQARAAVARQAEAGFDLVKTYNFLDAASFAAAVEEARARGIAIGGHIPQEGALEDALTLRIDLIAHGSTYFKGTLDGATGRMDPARLDSLARATRAAGTTVVPNIVYSAAFSAALQDSAAVFAHPEASYLPSSVIDAWRTSPAREMLRYNTPPDVAHPALQETVHALEAAGVPMLVGTDYPAMAGIFPGIAAWQEIRELEAAGLTRYRALEAATSAAGEFVRGKVDAETRFGRVAPGYRADLILLETNPLDGIPGPEALRAVVLRGRYFTRAELLELRSR